MLWIVFAAAPIVIAFALASLTKVRKYHWITGFAIIAALECAFMGKAGPSWEVKHIVASWVLGNIFPWGIAGLYLWLTPYPRSAILVASVLPVIYIIALAIGLVIGDVSGLIPQ